MAISLTEREKEQIRAVVFDLIVGHAPESPITEEMMCQHPNWPVKSLDELLIVDNLPVWDKMAVEYAKDFGHEEYTPAQQAALDAHHIVEQICGLESLGERVTILEAAQTATEREQRLLALLEKKDKQINHQAALVLQMGEQMLKLIAGP